MSNIQKQIAHLIEELGGIDEIDDRFVYLIERASGAEPYPEEFRLDAFKVPGCLSSLWVYPSVNNDLCYFAVDSDAQIPKGIAVVLASIFNGEKAEDIAACDLAFIDNLGIKSFLSPNRRNSLSFICSYIQSYAEQVVNGPTQIAANA